jgi:hypothetical protein
MYKALIVVLLGMLLFYGQPSIADGFAKYVQIKIDLYDMKQTVCPDN